MDRKRLRNYLIFMLPMALLWIASVIVLGLPPYVLLPLLLPIGILLPVMYLLHRRSFRHKAKDPSNTSVEQARSVEVDLPFADAYDLCMVALDSLNGTELRLMGLKHKLRTRIDRKASSRQTGRIIAGTRSRWLIFRNFYDDMRITIQLSPLDANTTRIHIQSAPTLGTAFIDFGYSLHNVNAIAHYLRRQNAALTHADRLNEASSVQHSLADTEEELLRSNSR